jgi:hypothetical protein
MPSRFCKSRKGMAVMEDKSNKKNATRVQSNQSFLRKNEIVNHTTPSRKLHSPDSISPSFFISFFQLMADEQSLCLHKT